MDRRTLAGWAIATILLANPGASHALDLMTGDGYLLSLSQTDQARAAAEGQLAGTLETLVVLNEVFGAGENSLFCLSDARASLLDIPLLREEFTDWLRDTPTISESDQTTGSLPVSMLALAFMSNKFACDPNAAAESGENEPDAELRSRLLESLPE